MKLPLVTTFSPSSIPDYQGGRYSDRNLAKELWKSLNNDFSVSLYEYEKSFEATVNSISECEILISSRMHPGLCALVNEVKLIQISYNQKIVDQYSDLGIEPEKIVHIDDLTSKNIEESVKHLLDDSGVKRTTDIQAKSEQSSVEFIRFFRRSID